MKKIANVPFMASADGMPYCGSVALRAHRLRIYNKSASSPYEASASSYSLCSFMRFAGAAPGPKSKQVEFASSGERCR